MAENSGLEEQLTKGKIGKVPVWAAGAMIAVLFIAIMVYRNRRRGATPPASTAGPAQFDPNAIDPNTGLQYGQEGPAGFGLPSGPVGDWLSQNPTGAQYPVGSTPQGLPAPITNVQWSRLVFDELVAKGDDPTLVNNALAKFLAGQTLTDAEKAIVTLAQTIFGAPPEGLIPINVPPVTPPPPTGPKYKDNNEWLQAALAWFGSQPNYAGTTATNAQIALNDYINGKPLGLWEQWTVNTVITGTNQLGKKFGAGIGPPPQVPNVSYR